MRASQGRVPVSAKASRAWLPDSPDRPAEEDGTERSGRQEHDLPLDKVRRELLGNVCLGEGRRRTKDQLGPAHRRADIAGDPLERRRVLAAKVLELDGATGRAMIGDGVAVASPHPDLVTGKGKVACRREGPVAAAEYRNSHESPQLLPCRSRLCCRRVRFCSSSDCASPLRSPRIDTTHSSWRRAMRRKLSRPLRVSRTITLRRSRGSS